MRMIRASLATFILSAGLLAGASSAASAQTTTAVVVLDPGHGLSIGSGIIDPGAVVGDLVEKEITLDVARYARDILERCEVEVHLSHERDDYDHSEADLASIVNGFDPTLAVSIHTRSADAASSGAQAWHTVVGYNDASSQTLAAMLVDGVARQFSIPNLGAKPESDSPEGELIIHDWNAPSALLELGSLEGDAELLRGERRGFARAIAKALLSYLGLPPDCADHAEAEGLALGVYFPGEARANTVTLLNDGLLPWEVGSVELRNVRNPFGAPESMPMPYAVLPGEMATWDEVPAIAPDSAGIHRQTWQLYKANEAIGDEFTVVFIVVPNEAADLKAEIEQRIEEIAAQGRQQIEQELEELRQQLLETAEQRIRQWIDDRIASVCSSGGAALLAISAVWMRKRTHQRG